MLVTDIEQTTVYRGYPATKVFPQGDVVITLRRVDVPQCNDSWHEVVTATPVYYDVMNCDESMTYGQARAYYDDEVAYYRAQAPAF